MAETPEQRGMAWAEFLVTVPPDSAANIPDLGYLDGGHWWTKTTDVTLHCEVCQGPRSFECTDGRIYLEGGTWKFAFVHFRCRNCCKQQKSYAVAVKQNSQTISGTAMKLGETPSFGPPTPARVITLIGPDREIFLKGRRSENRGLGIGAFSYYRRVVENQKSRIIEEIAKVAKKLGGSDELFKELTAAAKESQFSKAIDQIKHGLPQVLMIDGQNPLTLLHGALSEGLHEHTDEECLELARDIRVVLTELAERISIALKDEAELTGAVSRLLNRKNAKASVGGQVELRREKR